MTDRNTIREQLSAYLDGELDDAAATAVEAAAADDPTIAAELAQLKAARDMVRHLPREKAPPDFVGRVLAQAERMQLTTQPQIERPAIRIHGLRYFATAAVAVLAFGITLVLGTALYWAFGNHHTDQQLAVAPPGTGPRSVTIEYGNKVGPGGEVTYEPFSGVAPGAGREGSRGEASPSAKPGDSDFTRAGKHGDGEAPGEIVKDETETAGGLPSPPMSKTGDRIGKNGSGSGGHPKEGYSAKGGTFHGTNSSKGQAEAEDLNVPQDALAMLISTPDLPRTKRQVERVLAANGVQPLNVSVNQIRSQAANNANLNNSNNYINNAEVTQGANNSLQPQAQSPAQSQMRGWNQVNNFYDMQRVKDEVLVFTVVVPAEQVPEIQKSIEAVRQNQLSPQWSFSEAQNRNGKYLSLANTPQKYNEQLANARLEGINQLRQQPTPNMPPANAPATSPAAPGVPATQPAARQAGPRTIGENQHKIAQQDEPAWQALSQTTSQPNFVKVQRLMITLEYRAAPTQVLADNAKKQEQAATQPGQAAKEGDDNAAESHPTQAK